MRSARLERSSRTPAQRATAEFRRWRRRSEGTKSTPSASRRRSGRHSRRRRRSPRQAGDPSPADDGTRGRGRPLAQRQRPAERKVTILSGIGLRSSAGRRSDGAVDVVLAVRHARAEADVPGRVRRDARHDSVVGEQALDDDVGRDPGDLDADEARRQRLVRRRLHRHAVDRAPGPPSAARPARASSARHRRSPAELVVEAERLGERPAVLERVEAARGHERSRRRARWARVPGSRRSTRGRRSSGSSVRGAPRQPAPPTRARCRAGRRATCGSRRRRRRRRARRARRPRRRSRGRRPRRAGCVRSCAARGSRARRRPRSRGAAA